MLFCSTNYIMDLKIQEEKRKRHIVQQKEKKTLKFLFQENNLMNITFLFFIFISCNFIDM